MTAPGQDNDGADDLRDIDTANGDSNAENAEVPPDSTGYSAPPLEDPSTS